MLKVCFSRIDITVSIAYNHVCLIRGGGGGKALTMTMTPWNLPHGQWSKQLTMTMTSSICPWSMVKIYQFSNFGHLTMVILKFWPWSWSKMTNFDHLTTAILKFWPWSWSKIFDHLTMTPGRRPNGQKIMVILPPLIRFTIEIFCKRISSLGA